MNETNKLLERIGGKVLFDEPLLNHTSFHIGGPADILVMPQSMDDICLSINCAKEKCSPFYFIGNGSKLLVSDDGIRGIVIKIGHGLDYVKISGERIVSGAGTTISKLIKTATQNNLSGLEFASGIPGTLGGAVSMNAGANLGSISDIIKRVKVLDLEDGSQRVMSRDLCNFGYRESVFQRRRYVILEVEMRLRKSIDKVIREKVLMFLEQRKIAQPPEKYCAGSIFKNPSLLSAGKLIDGVGLKGLRKGGAKISEVHANFIVNMGNAKASDVIFLIRLAQQKVKDAFDIELQPEIICIGNFE